jgi:hypothetical protein
VKGTWRLVRVACAPESGAMRLMRSAWSTANPRPVGFGRWPIRR